MFGTRLWLTCVRATQGTLRVTYDGTCTGVADE